MQRRNFFEGERKKGGGGGGGSDGGWGWGWGGEFWEISGREEDEKRGFGRSGITPRCGEWETGIQRDRETALLFLISAKKLSSKKEKPSNVFTS